MNTKVIFCSKNQEAKTNYNNYNEPSSNLIFVEANIEDFLKYNSQMSVVTLFVPSNDYTIYPNTPTNKALLEKFPEINEKLNNLIEKITSKRKRYVISQGTSFIFRANSDRNIFFTVSILPNSLSTYNIHSVLNGIFFLIEKYNTNNYQNNVHINTILMQEIPYLPSPNYFDSIDKIFTMNNTEESMDQTPHIPDIYLTDISHNQPPETRLSKKRKR